MYYHQITSLSVTATRSSEQVSGPNSANPLALHEDGAAWLNFVLLPRTHVVGLQQFYCFLRDDVVIALSSQLENKNMFQMGFLLFRVRSSHA